jgi:peroxiredoxin
MRKMVLSLAVLALCAAPALAGDDYNKKIDIGQKAPDFTALPAADPTGGDTSVSLADIKEDVVVLVFLANHCPMVQRYDDRLIETAEAFQGKSVKFVGVCVSNMANDKLPAIKEHMKTKGVNYTYAHDETQEIGKAYNATVTPEFFVLDKARTIRYMGALDDSADEAKAKVNYVKNAVDSLLAGKEVETTSVAPRGCGIGYSKK